MIYFDSTYIIKCYVAEAGTEKVLALAQSHPGRACALHGRLEFWSGIKRHVREGNLPERSAEAVWRQFIADEIAGLWLFLPISRTLVEMSCTRLGALPPNVLVSRRCSASHLCRRGRIHGDLQQRPSSAGGSHPLRACRKECYLLACIAHSAAEPQPNVIREK